MRILHWCLKLAKYDYEIVYKAGKTNTNADSLSRNLVNPVPENCKIIKNKHKLNSTSPDDAEYIQNLLEKDTDPEQSHDEDEDEDDYYSDFDNLDNIPSPDSIPFTPEELAEPAVEHMVEALVHAPLISESTRRIVTRSRTKEQGESDGIPKNTVERENSNNIVQPSPDKSKPMIVKEPRIISIQEINSNLMSREFSIFYIEITYFILWTHQETL